MARSRGLTLCPIDGLSDSDNETPEDLGLSTSLSIYLREDSFIDFVPWKPSPLLDKGQPANDPPIMVLIAVSGANEPHPKYAPRMLIWLLHCNGMRNFGEFCTAVIQWERGQPSVKEKNLCCNQKLKA